MLDEARRAALRSWIAGRLEAPDLAIEEIRPLGGGSIQENWLVRCRLGEDARTFVLRKDAAATIASSRPRAEEFRILEAAYRAGVRVPEPVGFCDDSGIVGAPFALMALVEGVGLGPRIAKDLGLGGDRERLAEQLGRELAKIHAILRPGEQDAAGLGFLGDPAPQPALAEIAALRASL
ncbi:phosphotransferase, partial [Methylobacterium trifolii]